MSTQTMTGEWIRRSREARGWTQDRLMVRLLLDEEIEVASSTIRNWERGRSEPSYTTGKALERLFRRHRPTKRDRTNRQQVDRNTPTPWDIPRSTFLRPGDRAEELTRTA